MGSLLLTVVSVYTGGPSARVILSALQCLTLFHISIFYGQTYVFVSVLSYTEKAKQFIKLFKSLHNLVVPVVKLSASHC